MPESALYDARVYASVYGAPITKQDIFYYTYAVIHSPQYRKKYEQNLKREFPRLPFYEDFKQWRDWGEWLMNLHINYETQDARIRSKEKIWIRRQKGKLQPTRCLTRLATNEATDLFPRHKPNFAPTRKTARLL